MAGKHLFVANKGDDHELVITAEMGGFYLDNTPGKDGRKTWPELPYRAKTVAACKRRATYMFGEPQIWEDQPHD